MNAGRSETVLDTAMPVWRWNEYHSIPMPSAGSGVIDAIDSLTWDDVPLFRRIMRTTSLGRVAGKGDARVMSFFLESTYSEAHRGSEEVVYVGFLATRPDQPSFALNDDAVADFRDSKPRRTVKVAMNFLYRDDVLSTETRCQATDTFSARAFALYWMTIRAGSAVIRGSWLRGIRRRALGSL